VYFVLLCIFCLKHFCLDKYLSNYVRDADKYITALPVKFSLSLSGFILFSFRLRHCVYMISYVNNSEECVSYTFRIEMADLYPLNLKMYAAYFFFFSKCWCPSAGLHGVTTQNATICTVAAVKIYKLKTEICLQF
jgi:hypothetical protein